MVSALPIRRQLIASGRWVRPAAAVLAAVLGVTVPATPSDDGDRQAAAAAEARALFDRVWTGVTNAGDALRNGCGTITETRVSSLLARPLVFHGTFCASGATAFRLDYTQPEPLRIVYNEGVLNVTTETGSRTDVLEIGRAVERTRQYFSGPHASENLRRDFSVSAVEAREGYTVTLIPRSGRLASRLKRVVATVGRDDFVLRRLEIRGISGVESTFDVHVERVNVAIDPQLFKVYRPRAGKGADGHDGH